MAAPIRLGFTLMLTTSPLSPIDKQIRLALTRDRLCGCASVGKGVAERGNESKEAGNVAGPAPTAGYVLLCGRSKRRSPGRPGGFALGPEGCPHVGVVPHQWARPISDSTIHATVTTPKTRPDISSRVQ